MLKRLWNWLRPKPRQPLDDYLLQQAMESAARRHELEAQMEKVKHRPRIAIMDYIIGHYRTDVNLN